MYLRKKKNGKFWHIDASLWIKRQIYHLCICKVDVCVNLLTFFYPTIKLLFQLQQKSITCWASEMAWAVAAAALLGGAIWAASTAVSMTEALTTVELLFIFIFLLLLFEDFFGRCLVGAKSLEDRSFFSFSSGGPAADLIWTDSDVWFWKSLRGLYRNIITCILGIFFV